MPVCSASIPEYSGLIISLVSPSPRAKTMILIIFLITADAEAAVVVVVVDVVVCCCKRVMLFPLIALSPGEALCQSVAFLEGIPGELKGLLILSLCFPSFPVFSDQKALLEL